MDFFTVPTATFRRLYVFRVLAHERCKVLHFNVTNSPSAAWTVLAPTEHLTKIVLNPRPTEHPEQGKIISLTLVGGLHHRYTRLAA